MNSPHKERYKMPAYALIAREQYDKDGDKPKLIRTVWNEALTRSKKSHIVEKATKTILSLTRRKDKNS